MDTHQGYTASALRGAQCTGCDGWIDTGEAAVLLRPVTIDDEGSASSTALAHHGLLCIDCYEEL